MLSCLRRDTVKYVKGRKQTRQVELAKEWQEEKECRLKNLKNSINIKDWDTYAPLDDKGQHMKAPLKKAVENNMTHYLPALDKQWLDQYNKAVATAEQQKLDGNEYYWEFAAGTSEQSWITKQRELARGGSLQPDRLALLKEGALAASFDTTNRVRGHMQVKHVAPEGSWKDEETGLWHMRCTDCDNIRTSKSIRSIKARTLCRSCGAKKRTKRNEKQAQIPKIVLDYSHEGANSVQKNTGQKSK
jgi:hypothetical protein